MPGVRFVPGVRLAFGLTARKLLDLLLLAAARIVTLAQCGSGGAGFANRAGVERGASLVFAGASDGDVVRKGADSVCVLPAGAAFFV